MKINSLKIINGVLQIYSPLILRITQTLPAAGRLPDGRRGREPACRLAGTQCIDVQHFTNST